MKKILLIVGLSALLAFPALGDGVATTVSGGPVVAAPPNTTVTLGPVYSFLEPYILAAFGAVFSALLAWGLAIFQKRTGIVVSDSARSAVNTAAMNAAGRILASQDANFATAKIDVHSQLIADELPKVMSNVEGSITQLGMTSDKVASMIVAKVGQLQAQAQSSSQKAA